MTKKTKRSGDRFRLLIYKRMWQRWALPCLLIVPASIALWWFAPRIPIVYRPWRILALVPGVIAVLILAYTFFAARLAWVQCRPNHVRIQTPFYPLVISYGRIKAVRPSEFKQIFDPSEEKAARLRWLLPYWGKTALVVELSSLPINEGWLRLWFSPYMLAPTVVGFVFLVEDWMTLSRQLDQFREAWAVRRTRRRERRLARKDWR